MNAIKLDSVEIRISPVHGSFNGFSLQIRDNDSSIVIVDCSLTYEEMGKVIANLGGKGTAEVCDDVTNLGKELEIKREFVKFTLSYHPDDANQREYAEAARPFEVDGWMAEPYSRLSRRRVNANDGCTEIVFRRYVRRKKDEQ